MDDNVSVDTDANGVTTLRGALTIRHAGEWLEPLRAAVAAGAAGLDLAEVTECDSAGVQLLLSACRGAKEMGGALRVVRAAPPVEDALCRYGLFDQLTR